MRLTIERRIVARVIEVRKKAAEAAVSELSGYGAVFNSETVIGCWFREKIMPGAFAPVIGKSADVRSLFNHDPNQVLGRTTAGTLHLVEDETGLRYDVDVNANDPMAVGVAARIERKDVTGSSFGFRVKREEWIEPDDGSTDLPLRVIHEFADLLDVGPVTFPAYEESTAEARAAVQHMVGDDSIPEAVRSRFAARLATASPEDRAVPKNVSTRKAPTDTAWAVPTLADFTTKTWEDLSVSERSHIAGHFAWKGGDTFEDLSLPHHRASDGAIVLRGVTAAAGRVGTTAGIDKAAVRAHLEAHYHAFDLKAPWEADASAARAAGDALEADGDEAAELVQYQTLQTLLEQTRASVDEAAAMVAELIAAETESPTDTDAAEAAEEKVECARFTSLIAICRQITGAASSVSQLAQDLLDEHDEPDPEALRSADEDADRGRTLRLAQEMAAAVHTGRA